MRPAGHSVYRNKSHSNGLRPVLAAGSATIVNQEIGEAWMGHGATKRATRVESAVHGVLAVVGVLCAVVLGWALIVIFSGKISSRLAPADIQLAPRTVHQTFFEPSPVAGDTKGELIPIGDSSLASKLIFLPNSDVFLAFKSAGLVKGSVVSVPYPHFQSVDIRQTICGAAFFETPDKNWTRLQMKKDGSFYYTATSSLDCFELRVVGISPKNIQVDKHESEEDFQLAISFETAALQVPYFTFLAVILIAAVCAFAVTRDRHLPLYISYLMIASAFSLLMDGNGYSLFPGMSKASVIAATDTTGALIVGTVAMLWLMILGRSRPIEWAAFLTLSIALWNIVFVSEAAVRATNIVTFIAGLLIIIGAASKVLKSAKGNDARANALLLFTGVLLFNLCACVWILQNLSLVPSTILTRSAVKVGFMFESSLIMWAIVRSYRNKQEVLKKALEADHRQTQSEYYEAALHFVPRILLDLLKKDDIRNIEFGSTVSLNGSVVCFDIKGFTYWSENRSPEYILATTNKAWSSLLPIIHENNGAVVSFTGDGLIALFPNDPLDALQFLLTTVARKKNDSTFVPEFEFGMGVHYGTVVFGTVGQSSQMNLTVISDIVNTAARIEGTTRDTQGMIAASGEFIDACGLSRKSTSQLLLPEALTSQPDVGLRFIGERLFKGKHNAIELFDISLVDNIETFERSIAFINHYEGMKEQRDFLSVLKKAHGDPRRSMPVCEHYWTHMQGTRLWQREQERESG